VIKPRQAAALGIGFFRSFTGNTKRVVLTSNTARKGQFEAADGRKTDSAPCGDAEASKLPAGEEDGEKRVSTYDTLLSKANTGDSSNVAHQRVF